VGLPSLVAGFPSVVAGLPRAGLPSLVAQLGPKPLVAGLPSLVAGLVQAWWWASKLGRGSSEPGRAAWSFGPAANFGLQL